MARKEAGSRSQGGHRRLHNLSAPSLQQRLSFDQMLREGKGELCELENFPRVSKFHPKSKAVLGRVNWRKGIPYSLWNSLDTWQASHQSQWWTLLPRLSLLEQQLCWVLFLAHRLCPFLSNESLLFACSNFLYGRASSKKLKLFWVLQSMSGK